MTDNEIVKALECCFTNEDCSLCPLFRKCPTSFKLEQYALDLINRQQAEIERLKSCVKSEDEVHAIMKAQMEPMVKAITNEQIDLANKCGRISGILEFAESLKEEIDIRPTHSKEQNKYVCFLIDNLVKEKVGEEK